MKVFLAEEIVTLWPADNYNWNGELKVSYHFPVDPIVYVFPRKRGSIIGIDIYFLKDGATYWYFTDRIIRFKCDDNETDNGA